LVTTVNQQLKKTDRKGEVQEKIASSQITESSVIDSLDDARRQAEMAYLTYLKAQNKVVTAYRDRERQEQNIYKAAELKANTIYEQAITKAIKTRDNAEQAAEQAYLQAKKNAAAIFEDSVRTALTTRNETIEQTWNVMTETSSQVWEIFQGDAKATGEGKQRKNGQSD